MVREDDERTAAQIKPMTNWHFHRINGTLFLNYLYFHFQKKRIYLGLKTRRNENKTNIRYSELRIGLKNADHVSIKLSHSRTDL